jgi:hypothetical protein
MDDEGRQKKVEVGREKVSMFELMTLTSLNVRCYLCVWFFFFTFFSLLDTALCFCPQLICYILSVILIISGI